MDKKITITILVFFSTNISSVPHDINFSLLKNSGVLIGTISCAPSSYTVLTHADGTCTFLLHNFFPQESQSKQLIDAIAQHKLSCSISVTPAEKGTLISITYNPEQLMLLFEEQMQHTGEKKLAVHFYDKKIIDALEHKTKKSILQYASAADGSFLGIHAVL